MFIGFTLVKLAVLPSSLAVFFDVYPESPYFCTITPDLRFVKPELRPPGMVATIQGQAVIIAIQLEFLLPKPLFIGAEVAERTSLCGTKGAECQRYSQNQKKGSARVHLGAPKGSFCRILTLLLGKCRRFFLLAGFCKLDGTNNPWGQQIRVLLYPFAAVCLRGISLLIAQMPSSGPNAMLASAQLHP